MAGCSLSNGLHEKVNEDWRLAQRIRGSEASPLHRKIFGDAPLDGKLYRDFFERRVQEIKGEGLGFASCHGALACHTEGKTVRLSKNYDSLPIPPVIRLSFLIHEARHIEGFSHVHCPAPLIDSEGKDVVSPYQKIDLGGQESCDREELGAYGIQIVMLKNIAKYCVTCSDETRTQADLYANFLMNLILSPLAKKHLEHDF